MPVDLPAAGPDARAAAAWRASHMTPGTENDTTSLEHVSSVDEHVSRGPRGERGAKKPCRSVDQMRPMRTRAERTATTFVDHNSAMFGMPAAHVEHYQYANLYFNRITELRPKVEAAACARWGQEVLSRRVKTLDCEPGEPVLVVGTLYKDMKNKPNIMDEVGRDVLEQLKPIDMTGIPKYCGEEDVLLIEDELGRLAVKMPASLQAEKLVTGVVVGLAGVLSEDGELQVEGFVMPGLPPQPPIARPRVDAPAEERYIAIVSGLRVGCDAQDMLALQLLAEHLTGHLGCDEDHKLQANVVRLIVAGNAMSSPAITGDSSSAGGPKPNILEKLTPLEQKDLSGHVRTLDQFLTAVSASIPVDLMPGARSPEQASLPSQPQVIMGDALPDATRRHVPSRCCAQAATTRATTCCLSSPSTLACFRTRRNCPHSICAPTLTAATWTASACSAHRASH